MTNNINNSVLNSTFDIRDYTIKANTEFPKSFSLDLNITPKNQGFGATCVAHTLSSVVEYYHMKQHREYRRFSTEFIYGHREQDHFQGEGMRVREALSMLHKYGNVFYEDCPGNNNYKAASANVSKNLKKLRELAYPHRISAYYKITSVEEAKTALMLGHPIVMSMYCQDINLLINDTYIDIKTGSGNNHCMLIYGWNEKGWLIQNSYGLLYGMDGRFVLPYDQKINEMWGVADEIDEWRLVKPDESRFVVKFYKWINGIVNAWCNLFKK